MSQSLLFDNSPAHCQPAPYQSHSPTSRAAAEAIEPKAANLRERVFHYIKTRGPLSDNEGIAISGIGGSTYRPRRIELAESKRIVACGKRDGCVLWRVA